MLGLLQDAYKQVYNWQFVHCVDFWSLVLARGCEDEDEENELRPLIYPLVQIGLGGVGYGTLGRISGSIILIHLYT